MKWVVIDLETTGLDPRRDRIIEIGAVKVDEDGVLETFQTLVDPAMILPPFIVELTGISDEMLDGQPSLADVLPDFLTFVDDCMPVAHNANFELTFLRSYTGWEGSDWLDTITLAKMAFPFLNSYSLENLVAELSLANTAPHRALADAQATALLLRRIEDVFAALDDDILLAFMAIFGEKNQAYRDFLCRYHVEPAPARYLPPDRQEEPGEGERLVAREDYRIDAAEVCDAFSGEDGITCFLTDFQERSMQTEMANQVAAAFNDAAFLLAEAGTGTGKTMAYLIPAAKLGWEGGKPVILSTHTIHLQDQLLQKDIPVVNDFLGGGLRAVLVKGRNHYLCFRKWLLACESEEKDAPFLMARLLPWVIETRDGDVDALHLQPHERRDWYRFSAVSESCSGSQCPYFRSKCFVHRVRKQADRAHLIVINHSLLLTDAIMGGGVLPAADYLVVDEAHQLEKVAEETLGGSFTYYDHTAVLGDIRRFLLKLQKRASLPSIFVREEDVERNRARLSRLEETIAGLDAKMDSGDQLFKMLRGNFTHYRENVNPGSRTWRLDHRARTGQLWEEMAALIENYQIGLRELQLALDRIAIDFEEELTADNQERERFHFIIQVSRLSALSDAVYRFLHAEEEQMISWLEAGNERTLYPIVKLSPLQVDEALAKYLYDRKESIVFVSATLSVNKKFTYFKQNCGLNLIGRECRELLLPSPFDYEKQALLTVVNDIPTPGAVGEWRFIDGVSDAIIRLTQASGGRALALFTSHVQLREVYHRVRAPLAASGINVLAHELSGSRTLLLESLRADKATLLLGANSFWEGIDVAGEHLSLLIIVKLPFWPPDMPTVAARIEMLEAQKKNAFYEYSLPQAVIRFKQGFGRLLRKEDDRGIVCVLDRRLVSKRYGASFINSLPIDKAYSLSTEEIVTLIENKL